MLREHLQAETSTESPTIPSSVPTLAPTSILSTRTQLPSALPTASPDDPDALPPLIARSYTTVPARLSTTVPTRLPTIVPTNPSVPIPVTVSQPSIASPAANAPRRSSRANEGRFSKPRYIDEAFLSSVSFMSSTDGHDAVLAYMAELLTCSDTGTIMDVVDHRVYASKTSKNDPDIPTFQQAMNGPEATEYLTAMKLEIQALKSQNIWVTVDCSKGKSVLKGTWAFKLKCLPDGTAYRHKARFCSRGDMQIRGVDFFETYAPVVKWSTIRLLLSTVLTEGWVTCQVDYTNAFAQAELKEDVYVECPRLFGPASGKDKVLHLQKRSLYGLQQDPRTFFEITQGGIAGARMDSKRDRSLSFPQVWNDLCCLC